MGTMICTVCGHENLPGSLVCSECHPLLVVPETLRDLPSDTVRPVELKAPIRRQLSRHIGMLGTDAVALYINDLDDPLILHITRQAVLGRYSPHSTSQPRIDLTNYGAYEKGVSRLHSIIRRLDGDLTIEDLGSSNGTWVNGTRLSPYSAQLLRPGDLIKLGQVTIEIYFEGKDQESDE